MPEAEPTEGQVAANDMQRPKAVDEAMPSSQPAKKSNAVKAPKAKKEEPAVKAPKAKKELAMVSYRKEFYKANNKFGIKKFQKEQKPKQIFTVGHKGIPKEELEERCSKVLNDLTKHAGDKLKEEEIMLVAQHKAWKLAQKHGSGGST